MSRPPAAIMVVLLLVLGGCGAPGMQTTAPSPSSRGGSAPDDAAEAAYGQPPPDDGSIAYRSDVILVGGGAAAVRSVSTDGLTWSIDRSAEHLDDVRVGSVMMLTGMVVGRVLQLRDSGDEVAVTLGPVDLTDVISEGHFQQSIPLDLEHATIHILPDAPGALDFVETGAAARAPDALLVSQPSTAGSISLGADDPAGRMPPMLTGGSAEVGVGPFAVKLSGGKVEATYQQNGVDMVLEATLLMDDPSVDFALDVVSSQPTNGRLLVKGVKGIALALKAGSESGLAGNFKARVELPVSYTIPLQPPLYLTLTSKLYLETAFTARSSFLTAAGQYDLQGDLGWTMSGGAVTLLTPAVIPEVELLDQLEGLSLGVNGIVVAVQFKLRVGIGGPWFTAGPYAAVTGSAGLTVGADTGAVKCRQATTRLEVEGGAGYGWTTGKTDAVRSLLAELGIGGNEVKLESEWTGVKKELLSVSRWEPDVGICRL